MSSGAAPARMEFEHIEVWAQSFSAVLGQIAGSPLPCSILAEAPAEMAAVAEGDVWIGCAASGGLRGELSLRIPPPSALRLAQVFMSEPAPAAELTPESREAVLELLRQIAGLTVSALKPRFGEVQLALEAAPGAPSWPASATAWLRAGEDPAASPLIEIQLSAALMAELRAAKEKEAAKLAEPPPPPPPPSAPPPPTPAEPPSPQDSRVKLDLLLDVELAVTLRFGGRRLLLREVLDLNPGSVVELDRQVQEPVDVLLDGRVVARGEIVVIDSNYGLRVTEVAPPTV